jgi:hypothetical protein
MQFTVPVESKQVNPAKGELWKPLAITPPMMVNIDKSVVLFADKQPQQISVKVTAGRDSVNGIVKLSAAKGWNISPQTMDVMLAKKGAEKSFSVTITPPNTSTEVQLTASIETSGKTIQRGVEIIEYDHIPAQVLFPRATTRLISTDIQKRGTNIGYVMGAGDDVPKNLRQIGYSITLLEKDDITKENLAQFDAVMLGVRAFNTTKHLKFTAQTLFDYAQNGGTVIVQYNTSFRLVSEQVAPYSIELSRNRVTDETAAMEILAPEHPAFTFPNTITQNDFQGWVQERGLYFPKSWDKQFTPLLACHDPNETIPAGSLLVANHGKGWFVYTGLSLFRELPAGVPGAYRLLANLLSLSSSTKK